MNSTARSALATVVSALTAAGFKSHVATGRGKRPGFTVRDGRTVGGRTGAVLFDYTSGNGEFPRMCDALVAAGYTLTDHEGGSNYVKYGCARVRRAADV